MGTYYLLSGGQNICAPCELQLLRRAQMSLYINHVTDFPHLARGPRHSWGRAIYSPQ